jgi:hypothetical protein
VAWKQVGPGAGDRSVEAAGLDGGVQERIDNHRGLGGGGDGEITLGGSCVGMLGQPGVRIQVGRKAGGPSSHLDLKMSQRLAMASTWEILVGGAAPVRAPAKP